MIWVVERETLSNLCNRQRLRSGSDIVVRGSRKTDSERFPHRSPSLAGAGRCHPWRSPRSEARDSAWSQQGCCIPRRGMDAAVRDNAGFTMMESIVAIAITTILAGVMIIIVSSSFKGANTVAISMDNTQELLYIDKFIREKAENLYVPYWASMEIAANNFMDQLWSSSIAKYIESVKLIYSSEKIIRGIEVRYSIGNNTFTTLTLFSSKPLVSGGASSLFRNR